MAIDVTFPSRGLKLSGTLHLPEGEGPFPGIVISHPIGSVKEQSPANYAPLLAEAGFAALIFDAAYQGRSEGLPRQLEDPFQRAEDIKSAVSFLSSREEVDPERIGAYGICGSGGYVPYAAQTDRRIKAVATASAVNFGDMLRSDPAAIPDLLAAANSARTAAAVGESADDVPLLPNSQEDADTLPERSMLREAYDYYRTDRAQRDNAPGTLAAVSYDTLLQFDAWEFIDMISPRPLLMIAGTDADSLPHSETAIAKAKEPKELFLIEGASHVDLYDVRVKDVAPRLIRFFTDNL